MSNPKRNEICIVVSNRGYELAEIGKVRNGFIRTYSLKEDDLFTPERPIHLLTETVYEITSPITQAMALDLWNKIKPGQVWKSMLSIKKSILTGRI